MPQIVTIENDHWRVGVVPSSGGAVAYGQVRIGGEWVDVMRPTPDENLHNYAENASYPLVPWSNRIRTGKLLWAGSEYQLRVNFPDGTAIHGAALEYPWTVAEQEPHRVVLEFVSGDFVGVNWPWKFTARFEYALVGERFEWTMSVTNDDHETFPAGLGHHPYFLRQLASADAALGQAVQFQLNCEQGYDLTDCMPTAGAGPVPAHADFRVSRNLGETFVDDCFTGRSSPTLATLTYPGALVLDMEADQACGHSVVYIPQGENFFAVEPVTNANDAFNLEAKHIKGTGLFLVQPQETRAARFALVAKPQI